MLKLDNVKKHFKKKKIFDGINVVINEAGIYWIRGNNGEGKSTLFNVISGCIKYGGKVKNTYKSNMGYLFQSSIVVEYLTIKEQLVLFNIDDSVLENFNLMNKLNEYPLSLSSGERQKFAILLMIYSNFDLILLDEPFANLDIESLNLIKKKILEIKDKKIIMIISHQNDINNICDAIIELNNGKLEYKKIKKTIEIKNTIKEKRKINNGFKFYKKQYLKIYAIYLICFLLLTTFQFGKIITNKLVENDIKNSIDYNKFYLKSCRNFYNGGFKINKCKNPNEEELNNIDDWKYNYDLLLIFLYKDERLSTFDKASNLKDGDIPKKYNQVLANDEYKVGDILKIESKQIIKQERVDFYTDEIVLEVVGIYEDLTFYKEDKIYFKHELIEEYFKNKILLNNNISIHKYFKGLEIDNYKYMTFKNKENATIVYEGEKYEFYKSIYEIMDKVYSLVGYFEIFLLLFIFCIIVRIYKTMLARKQKSIAFLLANSFGKKSICLKEVLLVVGPLFLINIICSLICYSESFFYLNLVYIFILCLIMIIFICVFYSRKNISKLMREETW